MKTYQITILHAAGTQSYTGLFTDAFAALIDAMDNAPEGARISATHIGQAA
jgi:hypothetical protein